MRRLPEPHAHLPEIDLRHRIRTTVTTRRLAGIQPGWRLRRPRWHESGPAPLPPPRNQIRQQTWADLTTVRT